MKLLLILSSLICAQAFAGEMPQNILQAFRASPQMHILGSRPVPPTPLPSLDPIRQAKFKAKVVKMTVTKLKDNSYEINEQTVCEKAGTAAVFDGRNSAGFQITTDIAFQCPSTLYSQPVNLSLFSIVILNTRKFFDDEPSVEVKDMAAWTQIEGMAGVGYRNSGLVVSLPEMGQTTVYGQGSAYEFDGDENWSVKESFYTSFEIVDTP